MISVSNLSMRFGGKILFQNVNLQFNPGQHYGLVGANGSGKSTFLKILIGELQSETGSINIPSQLTIGTLQQDHYRYDEEEILNVVIRGKTKLWEALEKHKALLKHDHFTHDECELLAQLEKTIAEQEGYTAASEAAKLLEGLGIRENLHHKPLSVLSGGYKLRVLLAKVLFARPDILLLDEPTNHLDLFSIKWLEGYLRNFPGTILISSHDRDFLNGICNNIADVDYGTIKIYKGNYTDFYLRKQQDREQKESLLLKHDKRRTEIQGFIDRFGSKATKARQAQSKMRFVEQLTEEIESLDLSPSSRLYPKIQFTPFRASGATPLIVKEISKSYGIKKVLENVSFDVERGDRLAIIGPNGIGKSTLLEILTKNTQQDSGSAPWGFATRVAYFPQDHAREVQGNISLLDWIAQFDSNFTQEQLREILGRVLFSGDTVKLPVSTLSGGETARLILAKMMMLKPNILIFDEPTNHLDMEAIEELTRVLKEFNETILFVSHNRYFVGEVANRILEITENGVRDFRGSYAEYMEKQATDFLSVPNSLRQRYKDDKQKESETSGSYEDMKKQRNLKAQLKRKVEQAENECGVLEEKIRQLDQKIGSDGFYATISREEQQAVLKEKLRLENALEEAMKRWEEASNEILKETLN